MHKEESKINCPIFQKQESEIGGIVNRINKAEGVQEKAKFAEELQKEVGVLLSCADHDEAKLNCKNCHFIANVRKQTANLIIKTKKLG